MELKMVEKLRDVIYKGPLKDIFANFTVCVRARIFVSVGRFHQHLAHRFFVQKFCAHLFCTNILGSCLYGARILT